MGAIDTKAKAYLSSPDKVADAFNYWVYGGRDVIKPEGLTPLDTTSIVLPYGNDAKKPIQKIRDVLKLYTAMKDNQAYYLMLGIEIQAETLQWSATSETSWKLLDGMPSRPWMP